MELSKWARKWNCQTCCRSFAARNARSRKSSALVGRMVRWPAGIFVEQKGSARNLFVLLSKYGCVSCMYVAVET